MSAVMETRAPAQHPLMLEVMRQQRVIEDQAAVIRDLRQALTGDAMAPLEWELPRRQAQIFAMLVRHPIVSKERLFFGLYGHGCEFNDAVLETHISKMRARLRPHGVEIRTQRHLGYSLVDRECFAGGAA